MSFISNAFASISIVTLVTYMVIEGLVIITVPLWFNKLTIAVGTSGPGKVAAVSILVTLTIWAILWSFGGVWTAVVAVLYSFCFCNRIVKSCGISSLIDVRELNAFFEQKYAK